MERSKNVLIAGSLVGAAILIVAAIVVVRIAIEHRGRSAIGSGFRRRDRRGRRGSGPQGGRADRSGDDRLSRNGRVSRRLSRTAGLGRRCRRARSMSAAIGPWSATRATARSSPRSRCKGSPDAWRSAALGSRAIPVNCTWAWRTTSRSMTRRARGSRFGDPAARRQSSLRSRRPNMKSGWPTPAIASSGDSMPRAIVGTGRPARSVAASTGVPGHQPLLRPGRGNR